MNTVESAVGGRIWNESSVKRNERPKGGRESRRATLSRTPLDHPHDLSGNPRKSACVSKGSTLGQPSPRFNNIPWALRPCDDGRQTSKTMASRLMIASPSK
jgi:hypothetical protein